MAKENSTASPSNVRDGTALNASSLVSRACDVAIGIGDLVRRIRDDGDPSLDPILALIAAATAAIGSDLEQAERLLQKPRAS